MFDSAKAHADRLERSVPHRRSKLDTCVANRDKKLSEVKKLEDEYRLLTAGKLSPNASQMASAHVSPEHSECDSEVQNAMEMEETHPASSSPPLLSGETASCSASLDVGPPAGEHVLLDLKRPCRSLPPECGKQSSQPQLLEQISNCSEDQCAALMEQLRRRQCQLDVEREGRERDATLNCDSDPDLAVSGV